LDTEMVVEPSLSSWWTPISFENAHSRVCLRPWKTSRLLVT
jgi:hypothetical protein